MRYHNVNPNEVSYIEMHGTGTQAGDATEMRSVLSVFLPDQKRSDRQPLYLGSVKANVGHAESASGVSALIKVLLMMKNDEIPPHCGIKTQLNRNYPTDLAERNVRIAFEPTPWRRQDSTGGKRRVFLNNFSAAGGNTAILLEDAPDHDQRAQALDKDGRGTYLVAVTAKSAKSLKANIANLISFLEANPSTSLPALSYTTTARRLHYLYRLACSGDSIASVLAELRARAGCEEFSPVPVPAITPKVAFVFTGQGALYTGLGQKLFDEVSGFRNDIVQFNDMAQQQGFSPFLSLIDGSAQNLEDVDVCSSHLALTCVQMALSRLWSSWGIRPSLVVGHSLGEYAALNAAGVITASDAIFLVGTRAKLLEKSCSTGSHAMLAIKAPADIVESWLTESLCEFACINQPLGIVVSGQVANIEMLAAKTRTQGYEFVLLDVPFAFHSSQMEAILEEFERAAQSVPYQVPLVPVLSPLLKHVVRDDSILDGSYLARACRGVVNFQGALEAARATSIIDERTIWLEIGSHPLCSVMIKGTLGAQSTTLASLRKSTSPWKCIVSALESMYSEGTHIDWNSIHGDFPASQQVIQLPCYNWDLKNHWIMYKNDFCLTKGESTERVPRHRLESEEAAFRYVSPSIQRLLEENHGATTSTLVAESDIFDDKLAPVFRGHLVNSAALCPSVS
jgi:naphtho-gamma-pyrone polyketide synthase